VVTVFGNNFAGFGNYVAGFANRFGNKVECCFDIVAGVDGA